MNEGTGASRRDADPGVPEALPRVLHMVGERLGPDTLDRIWIFPPLTRGRREWGLVAAGRKVGEPSGAAEDEGGAPGDRNTRRRSLFVAPYTAERTGRGLYLDMRLEEQGEAPVDRLPRIMDGVVRRAGDDLGDPREIEVAGDADRFEEFLEEFDPSLLEEPAQPLNESET
ncbi:MAG: hypothetical protein PVI57_23600 [Gemmatimonadota bacterium]